MILQYPQYQEIFESLNACVVFLDTLYTQLIAYYADQHYVRVFCANRVTDATHAHSPQIKRRHDWT